MLSVVGVSLRCCCVPTGQREGSGRIRAAGSCWSLLLFNAAAGCWIQISPFRPHSRSGYRSWQLQCSLQDTTLSWSLNQLKVIQRWQ